MSTAEQAPPADLTTEHLAQLARDAGFELLGVAPVTPLGTGWYAPHAARFQAWLDAGHHADLDWLAQRAEERLVPQRLMPEARSAAVMKLTPVNGWKSVDYPST